VDKQPKVKIVQAPTNKEVCVWLSVVFAERGSTGGSTEGSEVLGVFSTCDLATKVLVDFFADDPDTKIKLIMYSNIINVQIGRGKNRYIAAQAMELRLDEQCTITV
jgi:hypothetical protein